MLELALCKANLDYLYDNKGDRLKRKGVRLTWGMQKRARKEVCVTYSASKNVLHTLSASASAAFLPWA